jgi:hypothetical protein
MSYDLKTVLVFIDINWINYTGLEEEADISTAGDYALLQFRKLWS